MFRRWIRHYAAVKAAATKRFRATGSTDKPSKEKTISIAGGRVGIESGRVYKNKNSVGLTSHEAIRRLCAQLLSTSEELVRVNAQLVGLKSGIERLYRGETSLEARSPLSSASTDIRTKTTRWSR